MDIVSTSPQITPQRILSTLQAYRDAAALNTAIELDLFTRIAHGADTAGKLAAEMGIPVRGIRLLCEYLAGSGLLEKEDEQLKLGGDAALFLDKASPACLSHVASALYSAPLLRGFQGLTAAVRNGKASGLEEPRSIGRPQWYDIARGVTDEAAAAKALAETLDFPIGQSLKFLEIGARDGAFGIALALKYPECVVVALDCPKALAAAQINADAAKLGTRYQNIPGDPLLAPLGLDYDAVLLAGALSEFDDSQITSLMMRIHYALKKSGQLLILEFLTDASPGLSHEFAGFRLNMLTATPRGDAYSLADMKAMVEASGFRSVEAQPLPAACATLVTARP
jgi:precorrin-6B methylase 2